MTEGGLTVDANTHCVHRHYLNNDVHKFILKRADAQGVDECLATLRTILQEAGPDDVIRIMLDLRPDGVPPINYTFGAIRKFYNSLDALPPMRIAYVYENSTLLTMARHFFQTLGQTATRNFFEGDREVQALEWLLADTRPAA